MAASLAAAELDVPLGTPSRPLWRGRLHQYSLVVAVPLLLTLIALAHDTKARVAVIVYAIGLCAMFTASATYHRYVHTLSARAAWQRADHAMIYAAIAGSSTPIIVLAMPNGWGVLLLGTIWAGALVGMIIKAVWWRHQRIVGGTLYMVVSWIGVLAVPFVWHRFGPWPVVMLLTGGIFYTVGAIGFLVKWPRLNPSVFSYHEVWHVYTVVAAAAQLTAVWLVVT